MNKYIITNEQLHTEKGEQEFVISALYNEKRQMIEVDLSPEEETSILGDIYIGRVENVVKNLNAAFIKIGPDLTCYYSLDDYNNPFFTKKISEKKQLVAGEELIVQVSREALKTKDPAVSTNINFTGKYAVLTTEKKRIGISGKLTKEEKKRFLALLSGYEEKDFGLIIRTNAKYASDEEVLQEIKSLEARWNEIIETAPHKTCYTCLSKTEPAYLKGLHYLPEHSFDEIITDNRKVFEEIAYKFGYSDSDFMTKGSVSVPVNSFLIKEDVQLRFYDDKQVSLSSLYSVKASLDTALKERVWLKSGAYLIIQPTEALTVIDVNSGKNIVKKDVQENFLKINIEAAKEIATQLRLRNLSGIIIVDFINLKSKEAEALLVKEFRAALKNDPVKTDIVDITKLGLVELTRKKMKKSLVDVLRGTSEL